MIKEFEKDGWKYYIKDGAAIIIGSPHRESKEIVIPEALDEYPVEEVNFYWATLHGYESVVFPKTIKRFNAISLGGTIKSIKIDSDNSSFAVKNDILYSKDFKTLVCYPPAKEDFSISCLEGVEIIADGAFACCDCIEDLVLPESVVEIGDFAFSACWKLKNIIIPDSVNKVGKAVFVNSTLKTIKLSKNIKELSASFDYDGEGEGFFQHCSIEEIALPEGIQKISYFSFNECENLKTVYIPASVKTIEDYAFNDCKSLEGIIVSEENEFYYSKDGVLYSRNGELLLYPANKKEDTFTVPKEVNEIHQRAFYKNKHLKKLTLGDDISKIGYRAFACSNIESINIPKKTEKIELDVFLYCKVKELYIPKWVSYIEMNSNTNGNINPYKDMTLLVDKDSYAEKMCIEHKLKYLNIGD